MSIDWSTRINRPFTFAQPRAGTESTVNELLGLAQGTLSVCVVDTKQVYQAQSVRSLDELLESELSQVHVSGGPKAD